MSALADLRVLEVSGQFTGVGGRLLAELGAEVVVVEPPGGSRERARPPFVDDEHDPEASLRWWSRNVGKLGVTIDLQTESGATQLRELIAHADIVIEGAAEDLADAGITYDALSAENPGLIWVSVGAFDPNGRRAGEPVTDLTMLAGGGPIWNCGYDDHSIPPIRGAGDQSVNIAGSYLAIGALVALADRDETGTGQHVDVDVNAAVNVTAEQTAYNWFIGGNVCTRQTGRHAYHILTSPVQVRCADGAYATTGVLPRTPAEFADLRAWLDELGLVDQLPEAVFLDMAAARETAIDLSKIGEDDEITAMLGAARDAIALVASSLTAKEFFLLSQRRGFPAGAVLSPDEAFEDEHFAARGFRVPVEHPELDRTFDYPGVPYLFSASPARAPRRPPLIGEHNDEVLPR